jgi:hypothetical protein
VPAVNMWTFGANFLADSCPLSWEYCLPWPHLRKVAHPIAHPKPAELHVQKRQNTPIYNENKRT